MTIYAYFTEGRFKKNATDHTWYGGKLDYFMGNRLLKLRHDTEKLLREESMYSIHLTDYSFVILPLAKCFEGFLKKLLIHLGLVKESLLVTDPYIAVNKYFNPKHDSVSSLLKDNKRDKSIPPLIYTVYQECRNNILHYDLHRNTSVNSYEDAQFLAQRIEDAIVKAYVSIH